MAELATAVLFSAGLDSAVLVADEARRGRVHPLYVSVGLAWEAAEVAMAERLLSAPVYDGRVGALQRLQFTMRDVYPPTHWAVRGTPPAYDTPDEDVYLTGRNLVLLAKAGTWCAQHHVPRVVLGPLAGNPFPDARPEFFVAMAEALSLGLDWSVEIAAPYRDLHKEQVIQRGVELGVPFELTLSCMNPQRARHFRCAVPALRRVQQVQGTARCLARSGEASSNPTPYARLLLRDRDAAVAGAYLQGRATGAEAAAKLVLAVAVGLKAKVAGVDGAVAGARIELGVDGARQLDADAAVAGGDLPVLLDGGTGLEIECHRSVAGVRLERGGRPGDAHAAIAGVDVDFAPDAVERDRSVPGICDNFAVKAGARHAAVT